MSYFEIRRLIETLRYLKASQFVNRLVRKFIRVSKPKLLCIETRKWRLQAEPIYVDSSITGIGTFKFLNVEHSLSDWNDKNMSKLWLYNLHYFDYLNIHTSEEHHIICSEYIESWIKNNEFMQGNGWEPYPTSLRIVNWIKWFYMVEEPKDNWLASLALQAHALEQQLEYHLLGNHLFANAKALVFAGSFFSGKDADRWLNKGMTILRNQIEEQILDDGGNFELSPMYHNIMLEDLLDLYNLSISSRLPLFERSVEFWGEKIKKMILWAKNMTHEDGGISFFNDAAFNIASDIKVLTQYASRLGISDIPEINQVDKSKLAVNQMELSGYISIHCNSYKAILDLARVGPDYIPGHAHADTLSFELSTFGQRVFVNSGTGEYGISDERLRQRKTAAHNTVEVDGQDSSEVWSGFRVARRAYPSVPNLFESDGNIKVSCSHNGYLRLPGKVTHNRDWSFTSCSISIKDTLIGTYKRAIAHYHIHPDIQVLVNGQNATLTLSCGRQLTVEASQNIFLEDTTWHPEFGLSIPNKKLMIPLKDNALDVTIRF